MPHNQKAYNRWYSATPKGRFAKQRDSERRRGIDWQLTFEQWWEIWAPFWPHRGRTGSQFCMARYGDEGPYASWNVRIQTMAANRREQTESGRESRAKLAPGEVASIRLLLSGGESQASVARRFRLHHSTISRINSGKYWKCIDHFQGKIPISKSQHSSDSKEAAA